MEIFETSVKPIPIRKLYQIFVDDWNEILNLILRLDEKLEFKSEISENRSYSIVDNCSPPYCPYMDYLKVSSQLNDLNIVLNLTIAYNGSGISGNNVMWSFRISKANNLIYEIKLTDENGMVNSMSFQSEFGEYKGLFDEVRLIRRKVEYSF